MAPRGVAVRNAGACARLFGSFGALTGSGRQRELCAASTKPEASGSQESVAKKYPVRAARYSESGCFSGADRLLASRAKPSAASAPARTPTRTLAFVPQAGHTLTPRPVQRPCGWRPHSQRRRHAQPHHRAAGRVCELCGRALLEHAGALLLRRTRTSAPRSSRAEAQRAQDEAAGLAEGHDGAASPFAELDADVLYRSGGTAKARPFAACVAPQRACADAGVLLGARRRRRMRRGCCCLT